jgi:hypothetical protein
VGEPLRLASLTASRLRPFVVTSGIFGRGSGKTEAYKRCLQSLSRRRGNRLLTRSARYRKRLSAAPDGTASRERNRAGLAVIASASAAVGAGSSRIEWVFRIVGKGSEGRR